MAGGVWKIKKDNNKNNNGNRTKKTAGVARPPQEDFLRIQDLLGLCLGKWWWFVISLGVTLSVAVLYLMMTPSVYTRSAAVMIKDNSKGGSASVGAEEFADLGLFKNSSNVYNELQTMKSPALMEEVVSRLGLNETFTVKEGLKPRELYKCAPIVVIFNDPSRVGVSFTIELSAQNQFTLDDFSYQGEFPLRPIIKRIIMGSPFVTAGGRSMGWRITIRQN